MTTQQILDLIRIFHAAVSESHRAVAHVEVNRVAMSAGYLIDKAACNEGVFYAMVEAANNYHTTFYKDFEEVLMSTRFDLFVDQMLHYMSTYGTNYQGETFTLNPTPEAMAYKELTPVRGVTGREMFDLCCEFIGRGVALKRTTLQSVVAYIGEFLKKGENSAEREAFDITSVANVEARCMLYGELNELPSDPVEFIRVAVYSATNNPLLISSTSTLKEIYTSAHRSLRCLEMFGGELTPVQKESLASVYYRFKDILVAMKRSFARISKDSPLASQAVKLINLLRHMAPRFKQPFRGDVLSCIHDYVENPEVVGRAARKEKSTYRLVRVAGYLQMACKHPAVQQYNIRNGKTFIRDYGCRNRIVPVEKLRNLQDVVEKEIVERLRRNVDGKSVRFSEDFHLAAPTSEKNFVGNFPILTSFKMSETKSFIGVYWRNEWGTHDFDLSYLSTKGVKIGWNANFTTEGNEIVFSGDMTNADPEASEILFFRKDIPDGYVFVNRFNGTQGSLFRLFFGKGDPLRPGADDVDVSGSDVIPGNTLGVNAMDVSLEADAESDSVQQLVGFIHNGEFYFMTLGMGEQAVSSNSHRFPLYDALSGRLHSAVDLRRLLLKAGAKEWTNDDSTGPDIDLSARAIDRTTVVELFR